MGEIRLCIVGDHSRDDEIHKRLRAAGLPISEDRVIQMDTTRKNLDGILNDTPSFYTRVSKQMQVVKDNPSYYTYLDWEFDGHDGLKKVPDDNHLDFAGALVRMLKKNTDSAVSRWNSIGVYNGLPCTTQSSIEAFKKYDEYEPLDWVHINGYIRKHIDTDIDALTFVNRLTSAITIGRDLAQGREVMVSWQGLCRLKDKLTEPLTHRDVFAWWQTIVANNADVLWWFRTNNKDNMNETNERLADAEAHAPIILEAMQSVEVE